MRVSSDSSIFTVKGGLFKFSSQKWKRAKITKRTGSMCEGKCYLEPKQWSAASWAVFAGEEFQQATHGKFWKGVWFVGKICEISSLPPTAEAVQSVFAFRSVLVTGSTEAQLTYSPAVCTARFTSLLAPCLSVTNILTAGCPTQPAERQRNAGK